MKVWLLYAHGGDYDSTWDAVCGVYSSEEAAERVKKEILEQAKIIKASDEAFRNALDAVAKMDVGFNDYIDVHRKRVGWLNGEGKAMWDAHKDLEMQFSAKFNIHWENLDEYSFSLEECEVQD